MPFGLKPWFSSASDMLRASTMRALDDASLVRISYSASVYHTPSNTVPARTVKSPTYPSHSLQKRNLLFLPGL
eukprot:14636204-Alexandrium_andersonii.AAC.1